MNTVKIASRFGEFCMSSEDGLTLFSEIDAVLSKEENICLDFSDVRVLIASFLNGAIAPLYGKYDSQFLSKHLDFSGLNVTFTGVIQDVVDNAKKYYHDDIYRKAQDEALRSIRDAE